MPDGVVRVKQETLFGGGEGAIFFLLRYNRRMTNLDDPPQKTKWYYRGWVVLLLLTPFLLGPFALPLLWKSPHFPRWAKITLTILEMFVTYWLVLLVIKAFQATLHSLDQLQLTF